MTDEEMNVIVNSMTFEGEFIPGSYLRREIHPNPSHWAVNA